jgi:short-subunit dehydrogenase
MASRHSGVVLITGCSSGFGYLTAKLLAENGYRVWAGVRKAKDLKVFGKRVKKPQTLLLDVTWPQERLDRLSETIIRQEKRIDVLVNNAGFAWMGAVGDFTDKELRDQYETNVFGLFKMTKAVLPYLRKQREGKIINISSAAGFYTTAYHGVYSSSKFAVEALTTAMRAEESLNGVDIVSVNPGSFRTDFWRKEKYSGSVGESDHSPTGLLTKRLKTILERSSKRGADPLRVARQIEKVIETKNPRKNYTVGWDALAAYWGSRLFPQTLVDWLTKRIVKRLAY